MHCSDEQLLAHLDGELSAFSSRRVERHLKSCWRCRTRRNACEQEIQRLTIAVDEWPFPPPGWNRDAAQRLNRRLRECESGFASSPVPYIRRFAFPVSAAALLLCLSGWFLWTRGPHARLRPAEVIAQVSSVERTIYVQPVQQTFSVEIAEIRPARQTVNAKLQIWSDRDSGRFASRLSAPGGALKHALWRPASDAEFVYRPAVTAEVLKQRPHREETVSLESLADFGLDPAELERAFMHWLESRSWNPISFASDISRFAAEDGSLATAERIRGQDGAPMIRITAQRRSRKMVAVLTVEVDSRSYWPRLQAIRFETPQRAIEFRLAATSIQPVRRTEMAASVFHPEPNVAREIRTVRPVLPRHEAPADPSTYERPAGVLAIDPRAVEARFVLHQAGACLGESVRVSEETGGTRVVRLDNEAASYRCELGLDYLLSALSDLRRGQPVPGDAAGTRTVALRHAWAMRRLGEDFPALRIADLPPNSWQMLETMLRDHTSAVRRELDGLGLQRSAGSMRRPGNPAWRASATVLFGTLTHLNELLLGDSAVNDPALSVAAINRRLDDILGSFALESGRRNTAIR
ncbi:MAG: zf-HC2 domain-containing protein [Candidatus Solibacter sp.]|nr:zf-HC2 domain-containing protein [Candidatus Solibacter sp.]